MEYNGWTNYETWAVGLWIDNHELAYKYWRKKANELNIDELTKELKAEVEEVCLQGIEPSSLANDLMSAALSEVNWREVAESLKEE